MKLSHCPLLSTHALPLSPLQLLYDVQRFLGVPLQELNSSQVKIHNRPFNETVDNYEQVRAHLNGSVFEPLLYDDYSYHPELHNNRTPGQEAADNSTAGASEAAARGAVAAAATAAGSAAGAVAVTKNSGGAPQLASAVLPLTSGGTTLEVSAGRSASNADSVSMGRVSGNTATSEAIFTESRGSEELQAGTTASDTSVASGEGLIRLDGEQGMGTASLDSEVGRNSSEAYEEAPVEVTEGGAIDSSGEERSRREIEGQGESGGMEESEGADEGGGLLGKVVVGKETGKDDTSSSEEGDERVIALPLLADSGSNTVEEVEASRVDESVEERESSADDRVSDDGSGEAEAGREESSGVDDEEERQVSTQQLTPSTEEIGIEESAEVDGGSALSGRQAGSRSKKGSRNISSSSSSASKSKKKQVYSRGSGSRDRGGEKGSSSASRKKLMLSSKKKKKAKSSSKATSTKTRKRSKTIAGTKTRSKTLLKGKKSKKSRSKKEGAEELRR